MPHGIETSLIERITPMVRELCASRARTLPDLRYADVRVRLDMEITRPGAMRRGELTPLKVDIDSDLLTAEFQGQTLASSGEVAGNIRASGPSLRRLAAWMGSPIQGAVGLEQFAVSGRVQVSGGASSFTNAGFAVDRVSGRGDCPGGLERGDKHDDPGDETGGSGLEAGGERKVSRRTTSNGSDGLDEEGKGELCPCQPCDDSECVDDERVGDPGVHRPRERLPIGDRRREGPADQDRETDRDADEQRCGGDQRDQAPRDNGASAGHGAASSTALAVSVTVIVRSWPGRMWSGWDRVTVTVMSAPATDAVPVAPTWVR